VILLDLNMPGVHGRKCCASAGATRRPRRPVIVITANDSQEMRAPRDAGANFNMVSRRCSKTSSARSTER